MNISDYSKSQYQVYAFSTENWNRSPHEVETLMDILCRYCQNWKHEAKEHNVRIKSWTTDSDQVSSVYIQSKVVQRHDYVVGYQRGLGNSWWVVCL